MRVLNAVLYKSSKCVCVREREREREKREREKWAMDYSVCVQTAVLYDR